MTISCVGTIQRRDRCLALVCKRNINIIRTLKRGWSINCIVILTFSSCPGPVLLLIEMCQSFKKIYACGCANRDSQITLCLNIAIGINCDGVHDEVVEIGRNCIFYPQCESSILRMLKLAEMAGSTATGEDTAETCQQLPKDGHQESENVGIGSRFSSEDPQAMSLNRMRVVSVWERKTIVGRTIRILLLEPREDGSPSGSEIDEGKSRRESSSTSPDLQLLDEEDMRLGWVEIDSDTGDVVSVLDDETSQ